MQAVDRAASWLQALNLREKPRLRAVALALAGAGFAVGLVLSVRSQPEVLQGLEWWAAALVALVAVPLAIVLNALEFLFASRLVERPVRFRAALEVTLVGSAANLLPLPGAAMVRVGALKAAGAGYRNSAYVTVLIALLWLAAALLYAGAWLAVRGTGPLALGFAGAGLLLGATAVGLLVRWRRGWALPASLAATKIALVLVDAAGLYLCLRALGIDGSFGQASVLTVSGPVAAMVMVLPGGLGLREAAAAALGPAAGLATASGFLAASLYRVIAMATILPTAAALAALVGRSSRPRRGG